MSLARIVALTALLASACLAQDLRSEFDAGRKAFGEGRDAEAVDHFLVCARLAPGDNAVASWLGAGLLRVGRLQEAASVLQDLVAREPGNAEAHTNLGLARQSAGLLDEAVEQYRAALGINPDLDTARGALAQALLAQGRTTEAEQLWRERLAARPSDPQVVLSLALVLERARRYADALALVSPPAGLAPSPLFAPHLARLAVLSGDVQGGLDAMNTLEARGAVPVELRAEFAIALAQAERPSDAAVRFEAPGVRESLDARGLSAYAECLGRLERWLDMAAALSDLTRRGDFQQQWQPLDRAHAFARLSWLAERAGDARAAEDYARRTLALDARNGTALAVLRRLGRGEDPFAGLESALCAGGAPLDTVLAWVREGSSRPNYVPPPAALDSLVSAGFTDADTLARAGLLFLRAGRLPEAIARLEQAAAVAPTIAGVRNNLGAAYELAARMADAEREYAAAVRLDPELAEARDNLARVAGPRQ